ncbi:hypothetical protein GGS20DRAFT_538263 [Poronia punctata]|nr:hypothetical protein GGS20DRAFT_538263 [Poronia punctata]
MDSTLNVNQKRKRGRPSKASRNEEGNDASNPNTTILSQNEEPQVEVDETETSRPRKRGRPAKNDISPKPQAGTTEVKSKRKGRGETSAPGTGDNHVQTAEENVVPEESGTKRRGRPKKVPEPPTQQEPEAEEADDENENEGDSSLLRRSKRKRRSLEEPSSNKADKGDTASVPSKVRGAGRRKKAPDQAADRSPAGHEEQEQTIVSNEKKRRTKKQRNPQDIPPPIEAAEHDTSQSKTKRGRRPKPRHGVTSRTGGPSQDVQNQDRPEDENMEANSQQKRTQGKQSKPRGRRRSSDEQNQAPTRSSSPDSPPPYRYIAKRTRRIPHKVIEDKWSTLDPSSISNIADLLHSVSQPTLLHVPPKQYTHAEDVLGKVTRGLCKRSGKLPFPPSSTLPRRADELDFEKTQSAVESLLSQLDPLQHSIELLRREKAHAEKTLEREYKLLDRLSTNARAEASQRRDQLRKVHVLVPEKTTLGPTTDNLNLLPAKKGVGGVFADVGDEEELVGLAEQINNHMQSMRLNVGQIEGVLPAIAKSQALLKTTLEPHLGRKQLENVMLGSAER